ncbi:MAG: TIGR01906 family membrane protein [Clostridia bacterium]|nr:TIGR01906 family membrane protein [Clostridia bacterium]MBR0444543.1 TIGR01906 family membrane protein [Clostridia bacterium]
MKKISVALATVGSMILIFVIMFTALEVALRDTAFINNEYTRLGMAKKMNMSQQDLVNSCKKLIDYMQGKTDSIDIMVTIDGEKTLMFDQEQEIVHMKDVQKLYLTVKRYRDMGIVAFLVLYLLAALLSFRSAIHSIAKGYILGAFIMSLFIGFIGTWAALDFSSFWTSFHKTLFWNDLWLFDPTTSRMINILPEHFFHDMVIRIVIYAAGVLVLLLVIAVILVLSYNHRRAKDMEKKKSHKKTASEKTVSSTSPDRTDSNESGAE